MDLKKKIDDLRNGSLTPSQNIEQFLAKIKRENKKLNIFLEINAASLEEARKVEKSGKKGPLYGLAIAIKSNINVYGLYATCASQTLKNYIATYDADVIQKIREAGGIIIGMTNCDEFACGSSGENSAFGPTENPVVPGRIPGGSSSGGAAAVAAGFCDLSLGSDTGGSIRNPASHCGIVGIKPTYGLVSRYGLIDLSMSLDQIGTFSQNVYGAALLLEVIRGASSFDSTTKETQEKMSYVENLDTLNTKKLGISEDLLKLCKDKKILALFNDTIGKLKKQGFTIKNVPLQHTHLAVQTYYPLVYTEFYSATRKFDGRKYGFKIEESCGEEVLRRILGGKIITQAEFKGAYYKKALLVKSIIREEFMHAFKEVDVILCPTVPKLPHKIGKKISVEDMYAYDALTIPANLAGICGGSVNAGYVDKIPVGIQVFAAPFNEATMFKVMRTIERGNENRA